MKSSYYSRLLPWLAGQVVAERYQSLSDMNQNKDFYFKWICVQYTVFPWLVKFNSI